MGVDTALGTPLVVRVGVGACSAPGHGTRTHGYGCCRTPTRMGACSANASRKNTEYKCMVQNTRYKIHEYTNHKCIKMHEIFFMF